jgi:hypothetical protein
MDKKPPNPDSRPFYDFTRLPAGSAAAGQGRRNQPPAFQPALTGLPRLPAGSAQAEVGRRKQKQWHKNLWNKKSFA